MSLYGGILVLQNAGNVALSVWKYGRTLFWGVSMFAIPEVGQFGGYPYWYAKSGCDWEVDYCDMLYAEYSSDVPGWDAGFCDG